MVTQAEAIIKAFEELGGCRHYKEISSWVDAKSRILGRKWVDFGTCMADMVPVSHKGNLSSNVNEFNRVLERCGSGKYRLIIDKNKQLTQEQLMFKKFNELLTKLRSCGAITAKERRNYSDLWRVRISQQERKELVEHLAFMASNHVNNIIETNDKTDHSHMKSEALNDDPRVQALLEFGKTIKPRQLFPTLHDDAPMLIEENPFAFALAAVLDRGTKSEIIWTIPYYIKKKLGQLDPKFFIDASIADIETLFQQLPYKPRYITDALLTVKQLSEIIVNEYDGDVSKIWQNNSSKYVKETFQRIYGVGPGISSMIVLLLERCYGIRFNDIDHRNMDVKSDVHIMRVFHRLGFISQPTEYEALNAARKLNPEYPGALDPPTWIIGKQWCASVPKCHSCPLKNVCPSAS